MSEMREQNERDAFLSDMLPTLLGECVRESTTWCRSHRANWPPDDHWCAAMDEQYVTADVLIDVWGKR